MTNINKTEIAIVGAGIVGLAMAYTLAKKGNKVTVFERTSHSVGASIRNFGMIWPIGQTSGALYNRAMKSREIYLEIAQEAGFWVNESGSLHLAYHNDEKDVLEEFYSNNSLEYGCEIISDHSKIKDISSAVNTQGLITALHSKREINVDPREVIKKLPAFLKNKYSVEFNFSTAVNQISDNNFVAGGKEWNADKIFICSGADFETLYPSLFKSANLTKCKLQMMRTSSQPDNWKIGASLCAGLTLTHYSSFKNCKSLAILNERIDNTMPEYRKYGIHVMASQNGIGEIIIGDSHEYSPTPEPFDKEEINRLILDYLKTFASFPDNNINERWHGIYPKLTDGKTDLIIQADKNVTIVNGLGGAGMTLSFGLAHEIL